MNDLNIDVDLAAKTKFNELLNELNDTISKKWLVLTNNGLNSLNDISNLFQKLFCEDEEENKCDLINDLQSINNHFEEIKKILESFKYLLDKLKQIESRLFNIFSFDFIKTEEFLFDKNFVKNLINSYKKEYELKELLVNQYLSQNRNNREELVAITCYWMHEPCLDQMLISQLKFLINYFKINS
jgi:hypothetical protein